MNKLCVTLNEAAEMLTIRPDTLRGYLMKGEIPAMHEGRTWRIPITALTEWFNAKATAEAEERKEQYERLSRDINS